MELTDPGVNGQDSPRSPPISGYFTDKPHGENVSADHSLGYDLQEPLLHGALDREILEKQSITREMEKARMREEMIVSEMASREIIMQMEYSDPQTALPSSSHQVMDFLVSPSKHLGARAEVTAFERKMAPSQSRGTECHGGKPSDENISGTKRKAESPPPPPRAAEAIDVPTVNNNMKRTEEDGLYCKVCKLSSSSEQALKDHLQGRKHKSKDAAALNATKSGEAAAENLKFPFWCDICEVGADTKDVMWHHERGRKHVINMKKTEEDRFYCNVCKLSCNSEQSLKDHLRGKKHKSKEAALNATKSEEAAAPESENDEQFDKANIEKDKIIEDIENEEVVCKAGAGEEKVVDAVIIT